MANTETLRNTHEQITSEKRSGFKSGKSDLKMRCFPFGPELEMSAKGAAKPLFCCVVCCSPPMLPVPIAFIGAPTPPTTPRREIRSGYSGTFITFMSGSGCCGGSCDCCCWAKAAVTVPASVDDPVAPIFVLFFSFRTAWTKLVSPPETAATPPPAPTPPVADERFLFGPPDISPACFSTLYIWSISVGSDLQCGTDTWHGWENRWWKCFQWINRNSLE